MTIQYIIRFFFFFAFSKPIETRYHNSYLLPSVPIPCLLYFNHVFRFSFLCVNSTRFVLVCLLVVFFHFVYHFRTSFLLSIRNHPMQLSYSAVLLLYLRLFGAFPYYFTFFISFRDIFPFCSVYSSLGFFFQRLLFFFISSGCRPCITPVQRIVLMTYI